MSEISAHILRALPNHQAWLPRLRDSVQNGGAGLDPLTVGRCDCCEFGRWLHDATQEQSLGATAPYRVIARLHAEFHRTAAAVVRATQRHDTRTAQSLLDGEFSVLSARLGKGLSKWLNETTARAA